MGVIILRSLSALPFHPAGGDVRLSLDQVILLLSLVGGSIYATASLTIKILEQRKRKRIVVTTICPYFPVQTVTNKNVSTFWRV